MRRVVVGNAPEDLAAFCHAEFPRLVGILSLYLGEVATAEDLAQETLLRTARQRSVVALRFFADRSVRETAAILGLTEDAVKAHTKRAMTTMRVELGPASEVDTDV